MTGFFVYDSFTLKFFFCVDDLSGKYKSGTFNTFFQRLSDADIFGWWVETCSGRYLERT